MRNIIAVGVTGGGFKTGWQPTDLPTPTIQSAARWGNAGGNGWVAVSETPPLEIDMSKPPFRIPTMAEVNAAPWNGYRATSLFSGCGGSSLGYRMAGFQMLYANEFVEAARDTYRANAAPYTVLDGRDIRDVTGADILHQIGLEVGELDLLDGSPPCASFSTAGSRQKGWGQTKAYSDTEQRTDDLFYEFIRILTELQPRTFVAENVSGLVKGAAKGYFKLIMRAFKATGYQVEARLLNAAYLGVPQARQRLIFVGVRADLNLPPVLPTPLPYVYTVRDALPWILSQADNGGFGAGAMRDADRPSPTIGASPQTGNGKFPPSMVEAPVRVVHDTSGQYGKGDVTDLPAPTITVGVNSVNSHHYQVHAEPGQQVTHDPETGKMISLGEHVAEVGACPVERRKFTLVELRAICGFPPDFELTGTYEQRWERLGRAVPPVMMSHIAATVRDQILTPASTQQNQASA